MGRWKAQSKGQGVGKPLALLDEREQAAGTEALLVGRVETRMEGRGAEHRGPRVLLGGLAVSVLGNREPGRLLSRVGYDYTGALEGSSSSFLILYILSRLHAQPGA